MELQELLKDIYLQPLEERYKSVAVSSVDTDSRKVKQGSLFVALQGQRFNGADFIPEVVKKGASVIVTSEDNSLWEQNVNGCCYLRIPDPYKFLRDAVKKFYGNPSANVQAIGITGTNGKTTTTYLIESILREADKSCGVIGTVNYRLGSKAIPSLNTTPSFIDNQQLLSDMAKENINYCIMEVSSHALDQGRVDLIDFKTAVFSNLTCDHLDYHQTMENYFLAKSLLFKNLSSASTAVINLDDPYGRKLVSMTEAKTMTYAIKANANVMAKDIQLSLANSQFKLVFPEGEMLIHSKLVGAYNVYNILAATAVCLSNDISIEKIKLGIEHLRDVPGRLEPVDFGQDFSIFIDYAHSPDALENVLTTIRQTSDAKIILVFGCGGNRDKTKRPQMGKIGGQLANFCIVTSDNPRNEEPQNIIDEIVMGFEQSNYKVIVDRQEAIEQALKMAQKGDIVLIAGKGHETYQIFNDRTIKFDERQIIRQVLRC